MGQLGEFRRMITSRKYIWEFAKDYAGRYGKNPKEIEQDILQAKKLNHISFGEYEWTGHCELTPEQKKTVSTLWTRMEFRKMYTDRRYIGMLMNKYIFSKVFAEFYGRKCAQASDIDEELLKKMADGSGQVVYKPNCKGMGKGIRILKVTTKEELGEALEGIRSGGNGIVEEYICQDEVLSELYPKAVSVVRFYSVCSPKGSFLFAPVLTVAHQNEISNGCQDALTSMVDIRTGEVLTQAVDQNEMVEYKTHPVTGKAFKGVMLPFWKETIGMMRRVVPLASKISNIGWDVAITRDGPILVEANTIPGFTTAQYSGFGKITNGYGYQPLFDAVHDIGFEDDGRYEKVVIKL
ncbi:MAG: hypothetical protein HFG82_13830 [Dorea sp.]|jgi:hypothetical protein|nr:hypothetical protein [Dorea sp.]